jgi:hypothetical protein
MKDLIVLAADKPMKLMLEALLGRTAKLRVRGMSFEVDVHPGRDSGVYRYAHDFLRGKFPLTAFRYALAVCDRDGTGREGLSREKLEQDIEGRLRTNGWENRSAAIVILPELESWVWGDWAVTSQALGWKTSPSLRDWLIGQDLLGADQAKPYNPKEAFQSAARCVRKPESSAIHQQIAAQSRFENCTDPAFLKLRTVLQGWFPIAT